MSLALVRRALETTLAAISPALPTAWENVAPENTSGAETAPAASTAYQAAFLLPAPPANPEIGPGYIEQGIFQVSLFYPLGNGSADATARAALIRAAFPFASTHAASGVTVLITQTPEVGPARIEDEQYFLPVRIRFQSHIAGG